MRGEKLTGANDEPRLFDKLDTQAIKAILAAEEESRRSGHKFLDTEQLLLGLMAPGNTGGAGKILTGLGLKPQAVRKRVSDLVGRGKEPFVGVETPFSERVNKVLESAWKSAQARGKISISTEDLLLGLSAVFEGVVERVFSEAGITAEKLREATEKSLS